MKIVSEEGNRMTFECGCVLDVSGSRFVMIPHSVKCEVYQYCIEESNRQGKPIHFYRMPPK